MKTFQFLTTLFVCTLLFTACDNGDRITGSGNVVTENQDFSDITKIKISDGFNAFVRFSDTEEKVEIEADDNLFDLIEVEKTDNELRVGIKNFSFIKGNPTLNVFITTKSINTYRASGAAHIRLEDQLIADDVKVTISGASDFSGSIEVDKLTMTANGASHGTLTGSANTLVLKNTGASQFGDYSFEVEDLDINLSGASSAKLTVNEKIEARLSGASNLKFKGDAVIEDQRLTGASKIERIN